MIPEAVGRPFGVGAFVVVAASCSEPLGSPLDRYSLRAEASVWGDEQRLEASDAAEFDQLGYSVSLAADGALLGAYGDDLYRGAAYVFARNGSFWTEEQKLVAGDSAEGDDFGWSVSLDLDRALVGAYGDDAYRGAAHVFVRSGSSWTPEQKLVASDGAADDSLGWSVSLDADRALVGAPGNDSARGAAYVFVRNGSSWTPEQELVASDGLALDRLGYAVSLDADRALVGAPGNDSARGAAYVFVRSGSSWTPEQKLVASDGIAADNFGVSVSLAGDRALLGAYWDDSLRGAAYVFVRNGSSWSEEHKFVARDGAAGHRFGNSVSLGADRALVGAYASNDGRGATYVFIRTDSSWSDEQRLVASDGGNDLFGWSVSHTAGRALIGAHYDDNLRGVAYVFSLGLCESDEDCPEERYCARDQTCQPRKAHGGACDYRAGEDCFLHGCRSCQSGHCADGVCCDRACSNTCEACTAALKGEREDGTCGYVAAGQNPARSPSDPTPDCTENIACRVAPSCNGGGLCDCSLRCHTGADCAAGEQCTSGGECVSASGRSAPGDDSSCGCRAGGAPGHTRSPWLGVALGLLFLRRSAVRARRPH